MKRLFVGFLLGATFTSALAPASSSAAPLEATTLSHVSPSGLMPGETVQLLMRFPNNPGVYVYHCHNLEHADNGMMRNYAIGA